MPFLSATETPDSNSYQAMLARSIPGGEVVDSRTLYGAGATLRVGVDSRPAELRTLHAQGRRRPIPITLLTMPLATRGVDIELSPHRSIPSRWPAGRLARPELAELGVLVAPHALAPKLFDATMEAALVGLLGSGGSPPDLRIIEDRIEIEWNGWPADESTVRAIFALVRELALRVTNGASELAGADGTLATHPDVVALAGLRAARQRIGRRVLAGIGIFLFITIALGLVASLTYVPR